jgi:hypothetical protein
MKKSKKRSVLKDKDRITILERDLFTARAKISALEKELVSALEEHGQALVQRNHAESVTQSFYDALRKALRLVRA